MNHYRALTQDLELRDLEANTLASAIEQVYLEMDPGRGGADVEVEDHAKAARLVLDNGDRAIVWQLPESYSDQIRRIAQNR